MDLSDALNLIVLLVSCICVLPSCLVVLLVLTLIVVCLVCVSLLFVLFCDWFGFSFICGSFCCCGCV